MYHHHHKQKNGMKKPIIILIIIIAEFTTISSQVNAQFLKDYESKIKTITANSGGAKVVPTITAGASAVRLFIFLMGVTLVYGISQIISTGKSSLLTFDILKIIIALALVGGTYQLAEPIMDRALNPPTIPN